MDSKTQDQIKLSENNIKANWSLLDERYRTLLKLRVETVTQLLINGQISHDFFLDYLLAQNKEWASLNALLKAEVFKFFKMPISYLAKLIAYIAKARPWSGQGGDFNFFSNFGASEAEIIKALEDVANRIE